MKRDILEQPFPRELLKSRKGTHGQTFSYVEGTEYIRRLNDAFEADWSFEVVEHIRLDAEVIVLGKLSAAGVVKMAFGGSSITVNREGEVISIADDLKAAATDALKKASSLLGVGLHLYSEPAPETQPAGRNGGTSSPPRRAEDGGKPAGNGNGSSTKPTAAPTNGNGSNGKDRLTQKQLSCIWGMARSLGRSVEAVREFTLRTYGAQPEQLTRSDASALITDLGEALSQVSAA